MAERTNEIGIAVTIAVVALVGSGTSVSYLSATPQATNPTSNHSLFPSSTSSASSSASSPCSSGSSTVIPQFARLSTNPPKPAILVLILQPGSTATLCVKYSAMESSPKLGASSLETNVFVETCSKTPDNATVCQGTPVSDVVVTPSPGGIIIDNQTDVTVTFTIVAGKNSTGHYMLAIPYSCPALPMAVGYEPAQLNFSDFPGDGPIPCPNSAVETEIAGVASASTTYIAY